jgi:hypothetical protein
VFTLATEDVAADAMVTHLRKRVEFAVREKKGHFLVLINVGIRKQASNEVK